MTSTKRGKTQRISTLLGNADGSSAPARFSLPSLRSISALTDSRNESTDEIRHLKRKLQDYEEDHLTRQRNDVHIDTLKQQLDELRAWKSHAEEELGRIRLEDMQKGYRLEQAQQQESRLRTDVDAARAREAKLRDEMEQGNAERNNLLRQIQGVESQLAKARDQADRARSDAAEHKHGLMESRANEDRLRAEATSAKLEVERVKEASRLLDEERARGVAALVAEQQKVGQYEVDKAAVQRARANVVARYEAKELELW